MRYLFIAFLFVSLFGYSQGIEPSSFQPSPYKSGILKSSTLIIDEFTGDSTYLYVHVDSLGLADSIYLRGDSLILLKNGSGQVYKSRIYDDAGPYADYSLVPNPQSYDIYSTGQLIYYYDGVGWNILDRDSDPYNEGNLIVFAGGANDVKLSTSQPGSPDIVIAGENGILVEERGIDLDSIVIGIDTTLFSGETQYLNPYVVTGDTVGFYLTVAVDTVLFENTIDTSAYCCPPSFSGDTLYIGDNYVELPKENLIGGWGIDATESPDYTWNLIADSTQVATQYDLTLRENPLTFTSPLSRTTNTISIPAATTSVSGYLNSTDWNLFNGKVNDAGSGAENRIAYYQNSNTIGGGSHFTYDALGRMTMIGANSGLFMRNNGSLTNAQESQLLFGVGTTLQGADDRFFQLKNTYQSATSQSRLNVTYWDGTGYNDIGYWERDNGFRAKNLGGYNDFGTPKAVNTSLSNYELLDLYKSSTYRAIVGMSNNGLYLQNTTQGGGGIYFYTGDAGTAVLNGSILGNGSVYFKTLEGSGTRIVTTTSAGTLGAGIDASTIGDITAVTVSAPITGGGTSGSVNIAADTTSANGLATKYDLTQVSGGSSKVIDILGSDFTTSATSLQTTDLAYTFPSTGTYEVKLYGQYTSSNTANGISFGYVESGGLTASFVTGSHYVYDRGTTASASTVGIRGVFGLSTSIATASVANASSPLTIMSEMLVTVSATGTLTFNFASESGSYSATLVAGSTMIVEKLN